MLDTIELANTLGITVNDCGFLLGLSGIVCGAILSYVIIEAIQ